MRLSTDDHYMIGTQHVIEGKPCQDHTLAAAAEHIAYAIVSDGCSSGGLTDIGARIVSTSIATAIKNRARTAPLDRIDPREIDLQQRIMLSGVRHVLGLSMEDMLATSAYACLSRHGGFIHMRGDGVAAIVYNDASIRMHRYDWNNNMPLYAVYAEDDFAAFTAAHASSPQPLQEAVWRYAGEEYASELTRGYTAEEGIRGVSLSLDADELGRIAYVAVFTDGVTQIDNVDWKDAVVRLLAFKNAEGAFAKRRMIRFVKDVHRHGDGPLDDLSYAVIRVDHEKEVAHVESKS